MPKDQTSGCANCGGPRPASTMKSKKKKAVPIKRREVAQVSATRTRDKKPQPDNSRIDTEKAEDDDGGTTEIKTKHNGNKEAYRK